MLFNSVIVHAAWRPYDPANVLFESGDPELMPQMKFMAQVAQLLVDLVKATAAQSGWAVSDHFSSSPLRAQKVWQCTAKMRTSELLRALVRVPSLVGVSDLSVQA